MTADLPLPDNAIQAAEDVITSWRHSPVAYPSSLARTVLVAVADDLRAQGAAAERAEAEADLADLRARLKATSDACNQARNELVAARTEGVAARTEGAAAEHERLQPELDRIEHDAIARYEEFAATQRLAIAAAERDKIRQALTDAGYWRVVKYLADVLAGDAP